MIAFASDNVVSLLGLFDIVSQSFVNDATVTGVLLNPAGATVTTFPLTYIAGSNGNYRGSISAAVAATLTLGTEYTVQVTATSSGLVLIDRDLHTALYL